MIINQKKKNSKNLELTQNQMLGKILNQNQKKMSSKNKELTQNQMLGKSLRRIKNKIKWNCKINKRKRNNN